MTLDKRQIVRASLGEQQAHWQKELGGELPVLEALLDYPRPPVQSFIRARETLELDENLYLELKKFCLHENVTLFMTLLAAFKVNLLRYTGKEDVIVGSLSSDSLWEADNVNRELFANPVALRTNLTGDPSVKELLTRVAKTVENAAANRDHPFEELVKHVSANDNLSRAPIFQVMLVLCNVPFCISEVPSSEGDVESIEEHAARCDLVILASEEAGGLKIRCEYDAELVESVTIRRMLGHLQTLLAGIVTNPEQRLSDVPLLTAAERYQLLVEWNATQTEYPKNKCIHELFETQVERTPDAVAVVFEDEQLTYRELNRRANQLAHHLRKLGVGPEVRVGLCVERSAEMVISLFGILKAGGVYMPLDPAHPRERIAFMVADAQPPVLVTQECLAASLSAHGASVVCLDRDSPAIAQEREENLVNGVTADNLAYVIYTSGSTGQPKGVQIPHRAVVNFLSAMREQLRLTEQDILLAVTTLSFDIAALELFLPLSVGARVVLVSREGAADGVALSAQLASAGVTVMQATPTTWRLLVDAGWNGGKPLRILCGGETLPQELAEQLLDRGSALWNLYGPTETTIWSAAWRVESEDGPVPIGRPIDNTQLYVLDAHLRPVPIGVPGELCIGGVGLARGYLTRPELTAERFMPHPFSEAPGARLYKTGDLARYRPDGVLEFLGRLDHQVKVRGYRIEPGEIEAVLGQHPAVREAVVLAREDTPGDRRLVAYVVADQPPGPSSRELCGFLQAQLPYYMVPAAVVLLESLPLTPNGKVDRRALPAPDQERPGQEETFVPPRTATEKTLAEIWATVLGLERVGVYDNFFALGGHSLKAMQIISRVRTVFPVELNLSTLFAMPTVAGFAEIVAKAATGAPPKTPTLSSISRETYRKQVSPRALPGPKETKKEV